MPFKTQYGTHYHEAYGCHGATIPCGTTGLSPCTDCCGGGNRGTQASGTTVVGPVAGGGAVPQGATSGREGGHAQTKRLRNRRPVPNDAGCIYIGYFIEPSQMARMLSELERQGVAAPGLSKQIACPHVTLGYMPKDAHEGQFGESVEMRVVGYGNDGQNEGVLVEMMDASNEALTHLGESVACPHVTISVANGAKPVNTRNIRFDPIPEPFGLHGTFGGYTTEHKVVTSPPVPPSPSVPVPSDPASSSSAPTDPDGNPIDPFKPMDNPDIPRDGLVTDVPSLAERVKSSKGMIAVMRGAPGCGKSTLLGACGDDATVVCPDEIRTRLFGLERGEDGKLSIPQRDGGRVWGIAHKEAQQACEGDGKTVVIDAMHARPRDIRQWQQLAEASGRTLVVVDMTDVPRDESRRRNAGRTEWKQVPESVIDRFYDLAEANTIGVRRQFPCVDRRGFRQLLDML